jgi:hypothetical protein
LDRLLVVVAGGRENIDRAIADAKCTRDGDLLDLDIFKHDSTFLLKAFRKSPPAFTVADTVAWCPIQQPLMMENLIFRPGLSPSETAQAIMRLAEHAVEEAYRRDAGEVYFLCRDESTSSFAGRYGFVDVATLPTPLKCYRLNLRETFGV